MTTSQMQFLSEILSRNEKIPGNKLGVFRSRLSNRFHELVFARLEKLENEGKMSKADLARKIGKKPEQITRWLGAPGNWTSDTFSDLLLGLGCEPQVELFCFEEMQSQVPVSREPELPKITDHPTEENQIMDAKILPFIPRPQSAPPPQEPTLGELPRMARGL